MELRYIRDTDKRESDFVVTRERKPIFAVECKLSQTSESPQIYYCLERLNIPKFYQVSLEGTEKWPKDRVILTNLEGLSRGEGLV